MPASKPRLSKSRYLIGMQCVKRLFFELSEPVTRPQPTSSQQAILDRGTEVGIAATKGYPDGVLIEDREHAAAKAATEEAMRNHDVGAVFEGAFDHNDVRIRADIMERRPGGKWRLVEVKSSTEVKDYHIDDVAVQYYVLKNSGVEPSDGGILHLDKTYVRGDSGLDYQALFKFQSLRSEIKARLKEVDANIRKFRKVLRAHREPDISPGEQCGDPFDCPYQDLCIEPPDRYSPLNLPRGAGLAAKGVTDIRNIPSGIRLSPTHRMACAAIIDDKDYISAGLQQELNSASYPIHFVDFEAFAPALPRYTGTRPFQPLPFQWSDHILHRNGRMTHREFLHTTDSDPREAFTESLLECIGDGGTICVYSSYEKSRLGELARAFPRHRRRVNAAIDRLWDLLGTIRRHYYHPDFGGSFSIKAVLPVLTPLAYSNLIVQHGDEAVLAYEEMIGPDCDDDRREELHEALLKYCEQDTLAMVEVRKALLERCKATRGGRHGHR